jgi:two-component system copper resistance phosphate regulon response regulator CusR
MRFLLVEDDVALAKSLERGLREQAYAVDVATDGEDAFYKASINPYDAIILDVNLPKIDGFAVCHSIRKAGSAVRILMLTARGNIDDRIHGLDSGADDYLVKPFEFEELLARLRALLRRRGEQVDQATYALDNMEIDFPKQRVRRGGEIVELTTKEYTMLAYLARNHGKIVGRAELTEHVWDNNHDPATNAVEVYINRLRKKLDRPGFTPLIQTRRGSGYYLGVSSSGGEG